MLETGWTTPSRSLLYSPQVQPPVSCPSSPLISNSTFLIGNVAHWCHWGLISRDLLQRVAKGSNAPRFVLVRYFSVPDNFPHPASAVAPWLHVAGAVAGSSIGAAYMRWDDYEREGLNAQIQVTLFRYHVVGELCVCDATDLIFDIDWQN